MIEMFIAFMASFIFIFFKATQQLNVFHLRYAPVIPCSIAMAICEVSIIVMVVKTTFWVFIPIGLGGGIGCLLSMKLFGKKK